MNAPKNKLLEVAMRIREMRGIAGYSQADMAAKAGVEPSVYANYEEGKTDFPFTFIHKCALAFGIGITDLLEGYSAPLSSYTVTRKGGGQETAKEDGIEIKNIAPLFRGRIADPYHVKYKYSAALQNKPMHMTTHSGQEFDYILSGRLRVQIGKHTEELGAGDSIFYNSSSPHGMIAAGGKDCSFLAVVLPEQNAELSHPVAYGATPQEGNLSAAAIPLNQTGLQSNSPLEGCPRIPLDEGGVAMSVPGPRQPSVSDKYVSVVEDEKGSLKKISFPGADKFNFAFDIIDELGETKPGQTAMIHVSKDKTERVFTFRDFKRGSAQCANYFKALGIKRGDKVMLVLKRHYQFWFAMLGLHKLGAVAIPATHLLQERDFVYRFKAAGVSAIVCTSENGLPERVDKAQAECPDLKVKVLVGGAREGWRDYEEERRLYSHKYLRAPDAPCGEDTMFMMFTSGTTGYPKIAEQNYKYALGHYHTAKYWHCARAGGMHLTISDTGWGKALWGKIYGEWMCETGLFVYDFERFDASDILPMFKKHNIDTFCAPPTMLRMMIKEDLSKYDLSSIRHITTAGEALNPEVYLQFEKQTGLRIMEGFGQTETTLMIANLAGEAHKIGSMGRPVPLYDIALLDTDGKEAAIGKPGEICIRYDRERPCGLFKGYYNEPEANAAAMRNGYYHTGDIAWRDEDGFIWYVSRIDDVIKSSGYRIGPFEIESVIMELPYVLECGVSAVPDEERGQLVKASVVLTKGTTASEGLKKEIQDYVKSKTAPYKYPRIVVFREELPKTISGKIQRNKL